jgi:pimeloyl-ACP methyl ester carboxylesterase
VPPHVSNVELVWDLPMRAEGMLRCAEFARVIIFDKRGTGLSDRMPGAPSLEERMDDVRAVMDAAGSSSAAFLGGREGAPMSVLFAATGRGQVAVRAHLPGEGVDVGSSRSPHSLARPWRQDLRRRARNSDQDVAERVHAQGLRYVLHANGQASLSFQRLAQSLAHTSPRPSETGPSAGTSWNTDEAS